MSYASEQAAASRTPQAILRLGVPSCANFYAFPVANQIIGAHEAFDNAAWTKTNCTVAADSHAAPNGALTADTLTFTAVNGNARGPTGPLACASRAFTGSVFLRSLTGTGTTTLELRDNADAEGATLQVAVTTAWARFSLHRLFTGAAAGGCFLRVKGAAGDLTDVVAWGANVSRNPADVNRVLLFPYRGDLLVSTCQAPDAGDGARCFYTFPTCQDAANYNAGNTYEPTPALRGIKEYGFCLRKNPLPFKGGDIVPALESYSEAAQEIDPRRGITKAEKITYQLVDDSGPGIWDLVKYGEGALVNTQRGQGTLFRRFVPIHKNYSNPRGYAKLSVGYVADGMTEPDYRLRLSGPIVDISLGPHGTVTIRATDVLENLKKKIPTKISDTNVVVGALSAVATAMSMTDTSEVDDPPVDGAYKVTLILSGVEKVNVTAKPGAGLTIQRGRWGTTAVSHLSGASIEAVVEFGTEQTTPSNTPLGIGVDDAAIEVLRRSGLLAAEIDSAVIAGEIDTWLPSTINPTLGTQSGVLFRRSITEPIALEDLLFEDSELCESAMVWIWQNENRLVTAKVFAPLRPTETVVTLTDPGNFVVDSVEVVDDNDARLSRVIYGWDLIPGARGDRLIDFAQQRARVLTDEERAGFHGSQRDKIIMSRWLSGFDTHTAAAVAKRTLNRFRNGTRIVTGSIEAKDDDNVQLGRFVRITTAMLQTVHGATEQARVMMVTRKQQLDQRTGRVRISLVDTGLFGRFWFWSSAADALPAYDAATEAQRLFAFWADPNGKVGATFAEPYRWW